MKKSSKVKTRKKPRLYSAPEPPLDVPIVPDENRSCDRKTSGPTAVAETASPVAEESRLITIIYYALIIVRAPVCWSFDWIFC